MRLTRRDIAMWTSGASIATGLAVGEHAYGLLSTLAGVIL